MAGTLIAAGLGLTAGTVTFVAVAFVSNLVIAYAVSQIFAPDQPELAQQDPGSRIQLPPATDNILPVVYGTAWVRPTITDAKISTDQTTMWYVCSLSEANYNNTIGAIYWNDSLITFDGTDATKAISLTDPTGAVDTNIDGQVYIYKYRRGSNSGQNTALTAIQVLQDAAINPTFQWTATDLMTDTTFIIVKVIYSSDRGYTGLANLNVEITSPLTKPGECMVDYLTTARYGCGVPIGRIATQQFTDLDTYSDQIVVFGIGPGDLLPRWRFDGVINTGTDCWTNLQMMAQNCDSWLQWNETVGQWGVTIAKPYNVAPNSLNTGDLFQIGDDNILGGIQLTPTDLNNSYNGVEAKYYLGNRQDKVLQEYITLDTNLKNPNEPVNILNLSLDLINDNRRANYLAYRRMLNSREDLVITLRVDWSGVGVDSGDVVRVSSTQFGWSDKLFRVAKVIEEVSGDGILGVLLTLNEYNGTIYADRAAVYYQPSANSGVTNPGLLLAPSDPTYTGVLPYATVPQFTVNTIIPLTGVYSRLEFWIADYISGGGESYRLLASLTAADNYIGGSTASYTVYNLPDGVYRVKARVGNGAKWGPFSGTIFDPFPWQPAKASQIVNLGFTPSSTGIPTTFQNPILESIGVGGPNFCVIGDFWNSPYTDYFYWSPTGASWTAGTLPAQWTAYAVAGSQIYWNGSYYLATAFSSEGENLDMKSPDGINWTWGGGLGPLVGPSQINRMAWAPGRWVGVGTSSTMVTSTDGSTWVDLYPTISLIPQVGMFTWFTGILWDGIRWIAMGRRVNDWPVIITSPDGLNWSYSGMIQTNTNNQLDPWYSEYPASLTYNGSRYVVGGTDAKSVWSDDLITWNNNDKLRLPAGGNMTNASIRWNPVKNIWWAAGTTTNFSPAMAVSTDGINWAEESSSRYLPTPIMDSEVDSSGTIWLVGSGQPGTYASSPALVSKSTA